MYNPLNLSCHELLVFCSTVYYKDPSLNTYFLCLLLTSLADGYGIRGILIKEKLSTVCQRNLQEIILLASLHDIFFIALLRMESLL